MLKDTIRVGIIGCGGIAFAKHMPFLSQISGVEIVGFYNPTEEKSRRAKEQYGSKDAKIYQSWQDLLEDPALMWCMCLHLTNSMQR